ncbi:MAG: hypothetical protein OXF79_28830 [Chloroflexi bacterium]|nr:hypothetical protein [Chloroflexota bacterium]
MIAIDPAPAKPSMVFDGARYSRMSAPELRDYVNRIASEGPGTLLCWDAPLTGPADSVRPGSNRYDFTKRRIERFFSIEATGFKAPKGISVLGYGECPHWTITRSLLGLPRVGSFDVPESRLPFGLMTEPGCRDQQRPCVVEIHPALAAWLWCRRERQAEASWVYKGSKYPEHKRRPVWREMWDIILRRTEFAEDLPYPESDDEFDAGVGYILGTMISQDETDQRRRCTIVGNARDGAFLVPSSPELIAAWNSWQETDGSIRESQAS